MVSVPPTESKWYIGELIEEITVEGEPRNVVHRHVKLLYANSPEEAYVKAQALADSVNLDPERKLVRTRFWGFAELNVVHDDSKIGAALFYEEHIGVPGEKSHHWVLPKTNSTSLFPETGSKPERKRPAPSQ